MNLWSCGYYIHYWLIIHLILGYILARWTSDLFLLKLVLVLDFASFCNPFLHGQTTYNGCIKACLSIYHHSLSDCFSCKFYMEEIFLSSLLHFLAPLAELDLKVFSTSCFLSFLFLWLVWNAPFILVVDLLFTLYSCAFIMSTTSNTAMIIPLYFLSHWLHYYMFMSRC